MATRRLIQVFLTQQAEGPGPNIFEVSTDKEKHLECNCPGFMVKGTCKHVKIVNARIELNGGVYPFEFADTVTTSQIMDAMKTEQTFRDFIIKHGKVEVF